MQPVIDAIEAETGRAVTAVRPTRGGFSHFTAHILLDGEPHVVKAANRAIGRAELDREAAVLPLLGADVPHAPLRLAFTRGAWRVIVLETVEGEPGVALFERDEATLTSAYAQLGRALARLHAADPRGAPPAATFSMGPDAVDADLPARARPSLLEALAHDVWRAGARTLIHGDAGLHNVLWRAGSIAALLDWEWAGLGSPQLDLAWLAWTQRWRRMPEAVWRAAIEAYRASGGPAAPSDADATRALMLGQIAMILARSRGNEAARAEWLRRLEWTMAAEWGP